jgi:hypothetical protein
MTINNISKFTFPFGYHKFHKKKVFNFQLNRWHSFGYVRFEDMKEVGQKIETFNDWKTEMEQLAEKAVSENRFMNAAFYYRAAEFYILQDNPEKKLIYDKFSEYFHKAFENDGIERYTHHLRPSTFYRALNAGPCAFDLKPYTLLLFASDQRPYWITDVGCGISDLKVERNLISIVIREFGTQSDE